MSRLISVDDIANRLLSDVSLLDVRAPVEFVKGHAPTSSNIPILNDDQRAIIGKTYRSSGKDAAIALGLSFYPEQEKELLIDSWIRSIVSTQHETILLCARGGLRSQIAQEWLSCSGYPLRRLEGGYKALRNFLLKSIPTTVQRLPFLVISGFTGSGKTKFIREQQCSIPILDLEHLAQHRGSAFGVIGTQPTQATFENKLAAHCLHLHSRDEPLVLVESESRSIGRIWLPASVVSQIHTSPILELVTPLDQRVNNIIDEYIVSPIKSQIETPESLESNFSQALNKIAKRLGSERCTELHQEMSSAMKDFTITNDPSSNQLWVRRLLEEYYDPMYEWSLSKRRSNVVGQLTAEEAAEWIHYLRDNEISAPSLPSR